MVLFYNLVAMLVGRRKDMCPVFGLSNSVVFFEVELGMNVVSQGNIDSTHRSVHGECTIIELESISFLGTLCRVISLILSVRL
jgi:hypothetical protein